MKEIYIIETTQEIENGKKFVCFKYNNQLIGKVPVLAVDGGYSLYDRACLNLLTFGIETNHLPKGLREAIKITAKEYQDKVPEKKLILGFLVDVGSKTPWALVRS